MTPRSTPEAGPRGFDDPGQHGVAASGPLEASALPLGAVHSTGESPARSEPVIARHLKANFILLSLGEIIAKVCTFLAFAHLARILGPERYGSLEFALAIIVFLTSIVDFGLGSYGAREISRHRTGAAAVLAEITGLRVLLAAGSCVVLLAVAMLLNRGVELKLLLAAYAFSLWGGPFLLQWFFQAYDRMGLVAVASSLRQIVFAVSLLLFFRQGTAMVWIGLAECASVLATGLLCLALIRFRLKVPVAWPALHWNRSVRPHWRQALPIGLSELTWASMWYFATVLLGFLFADQSLGWFGASHRVLMALHTFVWMYFFNLLPSISRCATKPNNVMLALMRNSMHFTAWTSLYGAFLLTILSGHLMTAAFGESFRGAGASLAILAWMLPVAMLSGHYRFALIAYNRQSRLLWCTIVSAVVAVVSGMVLVPWLGGIGAAWALLIANLVNFILVYHEVARGIVRIPVLRQLATPGAGLAAAVALFLATRNEWLVAAAATCGYAVVLVRNYGRTALRAWSSARGADELSEESALA